MDHYNWIILHLLAEQTVRERLDAQPPPLLLDEARAERSGIKRALASSLVRLGLRLDPAAGEGLGLPFALPLAQPEARR